MVPNSVCIKNRGGGNGRGGGVCEVQAAVLGGIGGFKVSWVSREPGITLKYM